MLIATIAIAGIPPLAGFFSKDEILANAFFARFAELGAPLELRARRALDPRHGAATCTAFYMFRLYYMTFDREYRGAVGGLPSRSTRTMSHTGSIRISRKAGTRHGGHAALRTSRRVR
jgi:NADH:ubiquinone oxidoreductase subunit 5 (subunit L)/multisubunit Na+/H+ antiporter MnhA subunit